MQESIFNLTNVKCAGCVGKVQSKVNSLTGIASAQVNLLDKTLLVKYTAEKSDAEVIAALASVGYGASLDAVAEDKISLATSVVLPMLVALAMMALTMLSCFAVDYHETTGFAIGLAYAGVSLAVLIACGHKIIKSGYLGFKSLAFNMHSLILLGIGSAWIYSLVVIILIHFSTLLVMPHVYFDSSLMILALINLGAYLEDKAKTTTSNAMRSLANLVPEQTLIIVDGNEQEIASNLLRTDYLVKIKPGSRIPADGEIIAGDGYLDESLLTGESMPLHKQIGQKVIGGSINTSGSFVFKVTAIGDTTLLSGIINLVKNAQLAKPKLAQLADKIAAVFVPVIIVIALMSGVLWYCVSAKFPFYHAFTTFMTVLLIACPCSVGLAIPVSLMVGVGRGASKGILIRDPSCLSVVDKVDVVLLDKTGTITEGKPQVVEVQCAIGYESAQLTAILLALEANSEHPLASAICAYFVDELPNAQQLNLSDFKSYSGSGVAGIINGMQYYAGSLDWMRELALAENSLASASINSQIYLANNQEILLCINIADKIKIDSANAIAKLQADGLTVAMVTGDNELVAHDIAAQVNINTVFANCKPANKIKRVVELQQSGHAVVFVGDGVNDTPSLMQADIGIAIGGGADIAKQSAAISLMHGGLMGVAEALNLAKQINRNMRQNLFGSFIYNAFAVVVAAGALYPLWGILLNPMIASVVMSLSSITVIGNSLRLRSA